MSADAHTVCPKCHPDLAEWRSTEFPGNPSIDHASEELGYDRDVRENYEYYMTNQPLAIVAKYSADCWTCGWHFEFEHEEVIS